MKETRIFFGFITETYYNKTNPEINFEKKNIILWILFLNERLVVVVKFFLFSKSIR